MSAPPLSLYLHIPWCVKKCPYCDFNSHAQTGALPVDVYVDALLADLDHDLRDFSAAIGARPLHSVFFGGGTPSLFAPETIERILDGVAARIALPDGIEVTLETNPGTVEHGRFDEYLRAGVWHIWSGIDHLLFLLSLLLPAVLLRRGNRWQAVPMAAPAFVNIVKVVTAFTLAHSITLSLAAFDVIRLPSRLTESVIAASIIIAALNNVFPRVTEGRWRIAFAFGLLHGFGFASVLAEMGLPTGARLVSLVAFNLGVEAGQLAVVLAIMPLAYLFRSTAFYRRGVMPWGSSAIACLALVWFVQRAML